MALSVDGTPGTGSNANGATTITATLATTVTGDICLAFIHVEAINAAGAVPVVSSVSSPTLGNFSIYTSPVTYGPGGTGNAYNSLSLWWAYASGTINETVTVTLSGASLDNGTLIVSGFTGFTGTEYITNPFDSNTPNTATDVNTTQPTIVAFSTISANTMVIMFQGSASGGAESNAGTIGGVAATRISSTGTGVGINNSQIYASESVYSSVQSNISGVYPDTNAGWAMMMFALAEAGAPPPPPPSPPIFASNAALIMM